MGMNELAWGVFGGSGVLLLMGAMMDLRWRRTPVALSLAILSCSLAFTVLRFVEMSEQVFPSQGALISAGIIVVLLLLAFAVGSIGLSDVIGGVAMILHVVGVGGAGQVLLAVLTLSGAGVAACLWFLHRARKSARISGSPRSYADVLALFMGRIEREPYLRRYPDGGRRGRKGRRKRSDVDLAQLEGSRTPDGCHLYRDPCPLITCFFVGYIALLIGVLW